MIHKRKMLIQMAALSGLGLVIPAFPKTRRMIRIVIPFAAGGVADKFARNLFDQCNQLSDHNQYVVINKPGATGLIAAASVIGSDKNNHELLLTSTASFVAPLLNSSSIRSKEIFGSLRYKMLLGTQPSYLVTSGRHRKSASEILTLLQEKKLPLILGSLGVGSAGHLQGTLLAKTWGVQLLHVPYNSSPNIIQGLLSGDLTASFMAYENFRTHIEGNEIIPLVAAAQSRTRVFPSVPIGSELGLSNINKGTWFALAHGGNLDDEVLNSVSADIRTALGGSRLRSSVEQQGIEILLLESKELKDFLNSERFYWSGLIGDANL
jgi:tripartite-type tricarboxylate transporter receptor subunit TctC